MKNYFLVITALLSFGIAYGQNFQPINKSEDFNSFFELLNSKFDLFTSVENTYTMSIPSEFNFLKDKVITNRNGSKIRFTTNTGNSDFSISSKGGGVFVLTNPDKSGIKFEVFMESDSVSFRNITFAVVGF